MVKKINLLCQAWWHVPLILVVGRLRQENKLKASLSYMVTLKLTWATRGKGGAKTNSLPPLWIPLKRVMTWEELPGSLKWPFVNTGFTSGLC